MDAGRLPQRDYAEEGADRRQTHIARLDLTLALQFDVVQEAQNGWRIEIGNLEGGWLLTGGLPQDTEQEPEGIAVAVHVCGLARHCDSMCSVKKDCSKGPIGVDGRSVSFMVASCLCIPAEHLADDGQQLRCRREIPVGFHHSQVPQIYRKMR